MKKKIVTIVLSVALMSALVFLFTGCGSIVNVNGNYKAITSSEAHDLLKNSDFEQTGGFELKTEMSIKSGDDYSDMKSEAVINYGEQDFKFSSTTKITSKEGGIKASTTMSIYADNEYVYTDLAGVKTKAKLTDDFVGSVGIGSFESLLEGINENSEFSLAESGNVKKLKIELDYTESGLTAPAEFYIVLENNKLSGMAVKCSYSDTIDGKAVSMKVDMQFGVSTKQAVLPSDLSEYKLPNEI